MKALLEKTNFDILKLKSFCKPLTLGYAAAQFKRYPLPIITPVMKFLESVFPRFLKKIIFWIPMGEMIVCAQKRSTLNAA